MNGSHRADQLHDDDGLAGARAAEDACLAAFGEGRDQVDDLDARLEHIHLGGLLREGRRSAVDGITHGGADLALAVHGLAEHVEDAPECGGTDGDQDGRTRGARGVPALQAIGRVHRHGTDPVIAQMLLYFEHKRLLPGAFHFDGLVEFGDGARGEFDVHHATQHLHNTAD